MTAGINIRPFAINCLRQLSQQFHVGIFTASQKEYCDAVVDQVLDPEQKLIKFRLYRQHCLKTVDGLYIKDLRVLDYPLSKVLIVDNSVSSFGLQLDNGIPITPFQGEDPSDHELIHVASYALSLANCDDWVQINSETFQLRKLQSQNLEHYIKQNFNHVQ